MKKALLFGIAGLAIAAASLAGGYVAGSRQAPAVATTAAVTISPERAAIEGIVRDYLISNPEIMLEVQSALEGRQQEQQRFVQQETIGSAREQIFASTADAIGGNPAGSVTLVEFFDYNCGYCKRSFPDVQALIAGDADLRVVYKEFPILGPDSQRAHIVSSAFRAIMPAKWTEFHHALMTAAGRADEASAMKVALSLGADEAALREAMKNPAIAETINATYQLAERLSITGTPSYVVGDEVVFGAVGKAELADKVSLARD